ncbi:MAG: WecB/TagA/CpsF family glycosyltransferase [Pseudanabaenaceae cyanobacterium SKYGB_i_bin29]|nr:WecB/TagA/CpsF family glycosyltransferase [Pseudanabaenaceae cyanobacterium SKYG29]MDW8420990.1 WecB/TagA/CpsF family glycosyltransferase [Pseudanabaenaceae cyanobacterium SKYGB_i_bin29]
MDSVSSLEILGLPLTLASDYLALAQKLPSGHIVTLNAEMVMLAQHNCQLAQIIRQAELVIPDGAGVVLYACWRNYRLDRCPGIDLAAKLLEFAGEKGLKVFFLGAKPEVISRTVAYWQQQLPQLQIVGWHHGYFDAIEEKQIIATLEQTQPDLILVALGVPKQEIWISEHRSVCPQAVWIGVGGSFDIWAGVKKRAPKWLGRMHLEWLYRLLQEPWRWRRMLVLPQFLWLSLWERRHN